MPGGDGPLRLVENDARTAVLKRSDRRRGSRVTITDSYFSPYGFHQMLKRNPVDFRNGKLAAQELFGWTSGDTILISIDREHVQRPFVCDSHSATLSDRIAMNTFMTSDNAAFCVNYFTSAR